MPTTSTTFARSAELLRPTTLRCSSSFPTRAAHEEPILRPRVSSQLDFEGEIAVVIGREGRHIPKDRAMEHVFGFTILMDGSVRDYQNHSPTAGKCFYRQAPSGHGSRPWTGCPTTGR